MLESRKHDIWISERWALKAQIQIWVECDTTITNNLAHHVLKIISSVSSVTQSCLTVCNPMDSSTPSFPVHHQLPELAQTHVHRVGDTIQTISSSIIPLSSCLQSYPESGSIPMIQFVASGGQSVEVSASTSVLPMNTQDWSPLKWTSRLSSQSKGLRGI